MDAFPAFAEHEDSAELRETFLRGFGTKDGVVMFTGPHKHREDAPLGFVMLNVLGKFVDGRSEVSPEFSWFPWASPRNIVSASVNFFNEMRSGNIVTVLATKEQREFMVHMCKYGICRRVGTRTGFFDGEDASMFETRSR